MVLGQRGDKCGQVGVEDNFGRFFRGIPPPPPPVIRLSLGKLLVNLLQVVKRTNTPLIP